MTDNWIKDLRSRMGLSRERFAVLIGASPSSVRRWERGGEPSGLAQHALDHLVDELQMDGGRR